MRFVCLAAVAALSVLTPSAAFGQAPTLSIANYQFVSEQRVSLTTSNVTYRADLVNTDGALAAVTATLTSLDTSSVQVVPGQDTLQFAPVPGNSQVTSSNTFTIRVNRTIPFDFNKLQWTFKIIQVPPPVANAGPNQIATVGKTITLDGGGSTNPSGIGTLTYSWAFTSRPAGSTATLSNPTSVMPSFVPDVAGNYVIMLTVSNGQASSSASVTVSTTQPPAPVANAGPDQTVTVGATVHLNGSASTSGSGNPLTYAWTLTARPAGSAAALTGANTVSPTFVVDKPGTYMAQLIVNDGLASSAPSTVTISTSVVKPVANAGANQVVNVNSVVQLNGSGSTDANGLPLTYQWSLISIPAGSAATLSNPTAVNPTFTADRPGTYMAQLIVNNGTLSSDPATVTITTQPQLPPVANAGPNQMTTVGKTVPLDGGGSTNPSGIGTLTYDWAFTSRPVGSTAILTNPANVMPSFVPDVAGNYVIRLTVSNGQATNSASVTISTTQPPPPVANAGPNQTVTAGGTVAVNGSASTSGSGNPLTYAWTLTARPAGSTAALTGANTVSPTFVVDKPGTYMAQLIVNDGLTSSAPSMVTISTSIVKPVANAGPAQIVNVGALVQLNGAGSTDANGLPLTYQWSLITLPPSSAAMLNNATAVNPTFTADRPGTYVAQLIVNNGTLSSDPATLTITTQPPLAPTANAGPNQTVTVGSTVQLNGSGTDPQNLPLTFQWSLINKPVGSAASLSNIVIPNPTLIADVAGTYVAQLIVNNGYQSSVASTVTIGTTCSQPTANPGSNQSIGVGGTVTLNGSGSGDACHDPLTYAWSFTTRPSGSAAVLSGANTASPMFVADLAGIYVVQLIVNNGFTNSNPATVTITSMPDIILPTDVTVQAGEQANFPVTLSHPAPAGGVFLSFLSSDTSKVTVSPANVFIPQGGTGSIQPKVTGIAVGSATITASASGLQPASQVVQVIPAQTLSFQPASLTITGPGTQNLTLNLSGPAQTNLTIDLSSANPAAATVPGTVTISAGSVAVSVPVTPVGPGSTVIHASALPNISDTTATVTIPGPLSIGVPASTTVALGQSGTFTVTLSQAAPASGVTVALGSSDSTKVTVPASVFIAAGATTPATQPQVTGAGIGSATVMTSATGYTSGSGTVTVSAPTMSFTGSPLTIMVGATGNLTLHLTGGQAPVGGLTVNLSSSDTTKVTVPTTVNFAGGATSVPVPVTGMAAGSVTITASATGLANATASVTVPGPLSVGIPGSATVALGLSATFAVTLSQAAPVGGVTVALSSSDSTKMTVPASVFIAAGATTPATQPQVTGAGIGSATVTASATGYTSGSGTVTVSAPTMSFTAASVTINVGSTGTLTLNLAGGQAPAGGLTVNLISSDPSKATVPATVNFAAGATSATVTVTGVAAGGPVTVTASATGINNATATVTVSPLPVIGVPASTTVGLGQSATFAVTLSQAAPTGGVTVNLASSDTTKVMVPASVFIAAGATTPATQPQVTGAGIGSATVTASATGYTSGSGTVTVPPPALSFSGSPLTINAGSTGNLTLNLTGGQAPGGGLTVNLVSSNTSAATVPGTVTFPAGATSVTVPVTGVAQGSATITASAANIGPATASVTVNAVVAGVTIMVPSVSVGQNLQKSITISISPAAPVGSLSVKVTSSDPSKLLVAGRQTDTGAQQVTFPIPGGLSTVGGVYLQGLVSSGTVTLTASAPGYQSGSATITLTPSGFMITGPSGGASFTTNVGSPNSILTLNSARLDSSLNFAEFQQVRGGFSASVNVNNSNSTVGTVGSPVGFAGGDMAATTTFTPSSAGITTLTAAAPAGFSTPASGNAVTGTVNSATLVAANVTVGNQMETTANVTGASSGLQITVTSNNPSLVKLACVSNAGNSCIGTTPNGPGVASLILTVPSGRNTSPDFYVYGLGNSGTVTYTATASGFVPGAGAVTLAKSGFVIAGPGGVGTSSFVPFTGTTTISVFSALLDASGNYVATQALAGDAAPASVNLTSANTSVGTISSSPVVISGGSFGATTQFLRGSGGSSDLTVSTPAGFDTPSTQFRTVTAVVLTQGFSLSCDGTPIGKDLEASCTVSISAQPVDTPVTLTSNSPSLLLSNTATGAGQPFINVTIPAGSTSATYFAQALAGSGTVTHTASSSGFNSRTATTPLALSGVVISGPNGTGIPFFSASVSGGPVGVTVSFDVLNANGSDSGLSEALRGGLSSVQVSLSSSNPSVGTITSPATIPSGSGGVAAQFTPLSQGSTTVSVAGTPAGFTTPTNHTSLQAQVAP